MRSTQAAPHIWTNTPRPGPPTGHTHPPSPGTVGAAHVGPASVPASTPVSKSGRSHVGASTPASAGSIPHPQESCPLLQIEMLAYPVGQGHAPVTSAVHPTSTGVSVGGATSAGPESEGVTAAVVPQPARARASRRGRIEGQGSAPRNGGATESVRRDSHDESDL